MDEPFAVLPIVLAVCVLWVVLEHRRRVQRARLRHELHLKMIESGKMTKEELKEILADSTSDRRGIGTLRKDPAGAGAFARFLAGIGWLGLATAFGLFLGSRFADPGAQPEMMLASGIVGGVSIGLAGLPVALREVFGRKEQVRDRPA